MISALLKTPPIDGMKIGLFGGSFNPAHQGHFALAKTALVKLQLDYIWWMVSPQNPLKPKDQSGDYSDRIKTTTKVARHPRFVVTDLEARLATTNTAQTLEKLPLLFQRANFVWLMGADSFSSLHQWNNWHVIPQTLPIAVFDRPGWTTRSLASAAAQRLKSFQICTENIALLPYFQAPAWGFIPMRQRPENSTSLRAPSHPKASVLKHPSHYLLLPTI